MKQLNFWNTLKLLEKCIEEDTINKDPECDDNILIYRREGEEGCPEGWYSESIVEVAKELQHDINGQKTLIGSLRVKGIEFKETPLPNFSI
jgi:hypothetical protein